MMGWLITVLSFWSVFSVLMIVLPTTFAQGKIFVHAAVACIYILLVVSIFPFVVYRLFLELHTTACNWNRL